MKWRKISNDAEFLYDSNLTGWIRAIIFYEDKVWRGISVLGTGLPISEIFMSNKRNLKQVIQNRVKDWIKG